MEPSANIDQTTHENTAQVDSNPGAGDLTDNATGITDNADIADNTGLTGNADTSDVGPATPSRSVRFLHTSDWQLGMRRHFLSEEAQARFNGDRLDAIATMARLATESDVDFVVVAGDIFEENLVHPQTMIRAVTALKDFSMPVYLLPGNHDCYDPTSVYRQPQFLNQLPDHVVVLTDDAAHEPIEGVQVVGAPWTSKQPLVDLATAAASAPLDSDMQRIVVAHGAVDTLVGGAAVDPATIRLADLEAAVEQGTVAYVALGDRHSLTNVGSTGRIWYSGAHVATDYREDLPGYALVVEIDLDRPDRSPHVTQHRVSSWTFTVIEHEIYSDEDLDSLEREFDELTDHSRVIVKAKLTGAVNLTQQARLDELLDQQRQLLGAVEFPERHRDIVIRPEDGDFSQLHVTGYVATARDRLQDLSQVSGESGEQASDALALMLRLTKESA